MYFPFICTIFHNVFMIGLLLQYNTLYLFIMIQLDLSFRKLRIDNGGRISTAYTVLNSDWSDAFNFSSVHLSGYAMVRVSRGERVNSSTNDVITMQSVTGDRTALFKLSAQQVIIETPTPFLISLIGNNRNTQTHSTSNGIIFFIFEN